MKVDFGRVTTTVAAFEITRPSLITTGVLATARRCDGEQRNRGIEVNVFGEVTPGVRLLGGVAFIDGRLTKTANGINDGKKAQGVADVNLNIGAEWDTPFIPGFTVTGRVIYTGTSTSMRRIRSPFPTGSGSTSARATPSRRPGTASLSPCASRSRTCSTRPIGTILHVRWRPVSGRPAYLSGVDDVQLLMPGGARARRMLKRTGTSG